MCLETFVARRRHEGSKETSLARNKDENDCQTSSSVAHTGQYVRCLLKYTRMPGKGADQKGDVQKKEEEKCKSRQKCKLDVLLRSALHWGRRTRSEHAQRSHRYIPDTWLVNMSSRSLSASEHALCVVCKTR